MRISGKTVRSQIGDIRSGKVGELTMIHRNTQVVKNKSGIYPHLKGARKQKKLE